MNWQEEYAGQTRTKAGKEALVKLDELEHLSKDARRIRQAAEEGLLPAVTPQQALSIQHRVEEEQDKQCRRLDYNEYL